MHFLPFLSCFFAPVQDVPQVSVFYFFHSEYCTKMFVGWLIHRDTLCDGGIDKANLCVCLFSYTVHMQGPVGVTMLI